MTYCNFHFAQPIAFERISESGASRRYFIFPDGENRTAIVMYCDAPEKPAARFVLNDWQVTSCDNEEEFVSRFGKPLYDLIVAEYDKVESKKAEKRELGVKLAAIMKDIPATIASEIDSSSVLQNREAAWKAKFAFIQNFHRLNGIIDHMYGMMPAEEAAAYYFNEVNEEFEAFLVVNGEYVRRIVEAIEPQYKRQRYYQMMQVTIELPIMSGDPEEKQTRKHDKAHHVAGVKVFLQMLETFLERLKIVRENESMSEILALMEAHTMCHEAIRGFKLFEQG